MELTKQAIEGIRLTCVNNKYYQTQQVDALLDEIADAAERMQQKLKAQQNADGDSEEQRELIRLKKYESYAKEEIQRLRGQVEAHDRSAYDSTTMLRIADQQARDILERARLERTSIMNEAIGKRERVNAANRASYYAALQFKQDIQRQMEELQSQLDAALGALTSAAAFQDRITVGEYESTASTVDDAIRKEDREHEQIDPLRSE